MKKWIHILISLIIIMLGFVGFAILKTGDYKFGESTPEEQFVIEVASSDMVITSPVFKDGDRIPSLYTCDGTNISPPLEVHKIPVDAKQLVLIVHDPDSPSKDWVHWLLYNIPVETRQIQENSIPPRAVQGVNDFNKAMYQGPCPPSGEHRYIFELYALSSAKPLPANLRKDVLESTIKHDIVAKAQLIGIYQR